MDPVTMIVGPIVGAIGGFANQYFSFRNRKLDIENAREQRAHDQIMREKDRTHEIEIAKLEIQGRTQQTALEGEIDLTGRTLDNIGIGLEADGRFHTTGEVLRKSKGIAWLTAVTDNFLRYVRPVLTGFLVWSMNELTAGLLVLARAVNGGMVDAAVAGEVLTIVVYGIVQLTLIAVGYWFGSRPTVYKPAMGAIERMRA